MWSLSPWYKIFVLLHLCALHPETNADQSEYLFFFTFGQWHLLRLFTHVRWIWNGTMCQSFSQREVQLFSHYFCHLLNSTWQGYSLMPLTWARSGLPQIQALTSFHIFRSVLRLSIRDYTLYAKFVFLKKPFLCRFASWLFYLSQLKLPLLFKDIQ